MTQENANIRASRYILEYIESEANHVNSKNARMGKQLFNEYLNPSAQEMLENAGNLEVGNVTTVLEHCGVDISHAALSQVNTQNADHFHGR